MSKQPNFEDAEDHEIFDINDFTTASDWERFIVQIEETINQWKLNSMNPTTQNDDLNKNVNFENGEWVEKSETIQFADETSFTITYHSLNRRNDEQTNANNTDKKLSNETKINTQTYEESSKIDFDSMNPNSFNSNIDHLNESFNTCNLPPKAMADLLSKTNDFKTNNFSHSIETPQLAYWYGISQFVTISPTRETYIIEQESKANLILSSASVAINNSGCSIPIFVRVHSKQREMFIGICEGTFLKTHFQIIHFNYTPPQYAYLSGLLEIFKSKLGNHLLNQSLLITISVRFTYAIQENKFIDSLQMSSHNQPYLYLNEESKSSSLDFDIEDEEEFYPNVKILPFGSYQECIDSIYLSCVWSNLSEDIIVDNDSYSDLNPQHSNDWSIILNNNIDKCEFKLTSALDKFVSQSKKSISVSQLLGSMTPSYSLSDLNEELKQTSLKKLTSNRVMDLSSNMMESAANKMKFLNLNDPSNLPIDKKLLDFVMHYLFPDAKLIDSNPSDKTDIDLNVKKTKEFLKKLNLLKSSSTDNNGLLNKLSICLCLLTDLAGTKAFAQIWKEFLLELRYRYDNSVLIPDLSSQLMIKHKNKTDDVEKLALPDLSRCLLHQKLQMLNCCIQKRLDRQKMELSGSNFKQNISNLNDNEDDEDEFFDCEDEESMKPDGRLKKFNKLMLLNKPNEPLYVPITQESTPMTEDMLEQHASVLVNLGDGDDAALLRAKIQSASLLSDMQSFKAANPDCSLEDFVRWYSPRDWVEIQETVTDPETSEEKVINKYELSNRMKVPDNIWVEVWSNAKPIPARKQKRLFDDTKEAENVFEWLNSLTITQIVEQTLPCLFYSAILTCYHEASKIDLSSILETSFDLLVEKAIKITRNNSEPKKYQDLIGYIKPIEQITSLMKAIHFKFVDNNKHLINPEQDKLLKEFLKNLLNSSYTSDNFEVKIQNGAHSILGKLILKMFQKKKKTNNKSSKQKNDYELLLGNRDDDSELLDAELAFDKPLNREYILRTSASRPAPYSRQSPQRMYCSLTNSEFRLAGAFTEDTLFF